MAEQDGGEPDGAGKPGVIRTREDVVVTSAPDPQGGRVYYIKISGTGEIFELGQDEFEIWKQFEGGTSLDAAEHVIGARFGETIREKLRTFVTDLAMRGLLSGDFPPGLIEEAEQDVPVDGRAFLIDPHKRYRRRRRWYRFVLMDPNDLFAFLARWLGLLRYIRWPLVGLAAVALLVLIKHAADYSADFRTDLLQWPRVKHGVLTFLTINITRVLAQGTVSRYYGAQVRWLSVDLVFGFWPRFHEDKKGILLLTRTPQLWSHATPTFVRLFYFSIGTLGWWWARGNGSNLSTYLLMISQASIVDFVIATLPIFKTESYFWFCAFFRDPLLQSRGRAALQSALFVKSTLRYTSPIERLALTLYGLSMVFALVAMLLCMTTFAIGLTGSYGGAGVVLFLILVALAALRYGTVRALRSRIMEAKAERQAGLRAARRRSRGGLALAPAPNGDTGVDLRRSSTIAGEPG